MKSMSIEDLRKLVAKLEKLHKSEEHKILIERELNYYTAWLKYYEAVERRKTHAAVELSIKSWKVLHKLLKNFDDLHFIRKEIKKQVLGEIKKKTG